MMLICPCACVSVLLRKLQVYGFAPCGPSLKSYKTAKKLPQSVQKPWSQEAPGKCK